MQLPAIKALHDKAIKELKAVQSGHTNNGLGTIVDVARYSAIASVCAALRKDLRTSSAQIDEHQPTSAENETGPGT